MNAGEIVTPLMLAKCHVQGHADFEGVGFGPTGFGEHGVLRHG